MFTTEFFFTNFHSHSKLLAYSKTLEWAKCFGKRPIINLRPWGGIPLRTWNIFLMNQTLCKEKVRNGNILGAWWSAKIYVNVSRERVRNGKTRAHKSGRRPSSAHCLSNVNRGLWKAFKKIHLTYFLKWFPPKYLRKCLKRKSKKSGCCPSRAHCLSIMNRGQWIMFLGESFTQTQLLGLTLQSYNTGCKSLLSCLDKILWLHEPVQ